MSPLTRLGHLGWLTYGVFSFSLFSSGCDEETRGHTIVHSTPTYVLAENCRTRCEGRLISCDLPEHEVMLTCIAVCGDDPTEGDLDCIARRSCEDIRGDLTRRRSICGLGEDIPVEVPVAEPAEEVEGACRSTCDCGDGPFEVISVLLIAPGGDAFCPPEAEVCERVCEVQGGFGQSGP